MRLRKLQLKDAPFMLEWMHEPSVIEFLQTDFTSKIMEDCEKFIILSQEDSGNLHMAIVDDNDTYMGTVSLKNIYEGTAEFAITVRKEAMGAGYSQYAMKEILCMGKNKLHLKYIYWCVNPENKRAVRFYEKNGYKIMSEDVKNMLKEQMFVGGGYSKEQIKNYMWYMVS